MSEKLGVKETKEVLEGANELALLIIEQAKDGLQATDVVGVVQKILANDEVKAKLAAAVEGIKAVPAEVKDLDVAEIVELAEVQLKYMPKVVAALQKEKA